MRDLSLSKTRQHLRVRTGINSGLVGLIVNILLVAIKLIAGFTANSVAILADAMNSLGDGLSAILTIGGFYVASKPADREHPFGHQRAEYISGLFTAIIILFVGFQFLLASIEKIQSPQSVEKSTLVLFLLILSISIKAGLGIYYYRKNNKMDSKSSAIDALMKDSFYDVIINLVIIVSYIVEVQYDLYIDGYIGILVALFILFGGFSTIIESSNDLLGTRPNPELVKKMQNVLDSYEDLVGYHDLILHRYGPNKLFATVDIEVDSRWDLIEAHQVIDAIEVEFKEKFDIVLVGHLDPIVLNDDEQNELYKIIKNILKSYDGSFHFHDFRVEDHEDIKYVYFDVVVPDAIDVSDKRIYEKIEKDVNEVTKQKVVLHIEFDRNYVLEE